MKPMMPFLSFSSSRPQCSSCIRRTINGFNDVWLQTTRPQTRAKSKKLPRSTTIKVRLLANIPGFGRKGSIIPISPGRMRNDLFPNKSAEYMTVAQLRERGLVDAVMERDWTYRIPQHEVELPIQKPKRVARKVSEQKDNPITVEVNLLDPEIATALASRLLPDNIAEFYRTPISSTTSPPKPSPSLTSTSAVSVIAQEAQETARLPSQRVKIHGSVTSVDILESIRAELAKDVEGASVVLAPEDIIFADELEEKYRVKHLGIYNVDIKVKGARQGVRRTITIKASE